MMGQAPDAAGRSAVASADGDAVAHALDLAAKLHQRSVQPLVLQVARGERPSAPVVVDLDPTTVCDLACPECISSEVLHTGRLGGDRIVRLAGELAEAGVRAVILIGGGEPLLHRRIGEVIDVLHDNGIRIGLVTNGTQIDRYIDRLATKLDWVRVSVDAATGATFDEFRPARSGRSAFPRVIENMRLLAQRSYRPVGYSFLLMQRRDASGQVIASNYSEVLAAGRLAKDIGCAYFELKAALDEHHFTVNQRQEDIAEVRDQLDQLRASEDDRFRILTSSNWLAVEGTRDPVEHKEYATCRVSQLRTTITPNGVYVCPYHRGNPKGRIADVTDMPFAQAWATAGPGVDPRTDCQFICARHDSNLLIESLAAGAPVPPPSDDLDLFL
jgi:molybdenum cofactor biosynthesis enzyme MoaA